MISRRASCLRLLWRQEGRQLFEVGRSFGRAVPATGWERAASRAPREPDARGAAHETVWLPPGGDAGSWTSAVAGFAVPAVRSTHGEGDAPLAHSARCAPALFFPARRPASAAPPARRRPPERASHSGTRHARRALHTDRVPPPLWLVRSPLRSGSSCRSHAPTRQASSGLDPQPESRARLLVDARLRRISTQRARSLVPSVCSGNCSQAHSYSRGPRLSSPAESTTQASGGKSAASSPTGCWRPCTHTVWVSGTATT